MEIKFDGAEANQHHIEAYEGVESIAGITRVAGLVAHYAATGKVRFRRPFSQDIKYYFERTEPGSLGLIFSTVARNAGQANALADKASKLLRRVIRRATGQVAERDLTVGDTIIPAGDIDVLAEAVEPSLRRGHAWIDSRGKKISIKSDGYPATLLNSETREYLETEEEAEELDVQDVSVGAVNVNGRSGRVFFHDLGRTVPFRAPKTATARTIPTLSRFLVQYADKTGATVNINFRRIFYPDQRLKRVLIYDCYPIEGRQ
ncbi:hypothetical protein [Sphingomonas sp. SUN039]|uniref:DUF7946 domain-containing protein n=1 Tax=Sphingomonas sp. SUN039 TaxID=2937787 RepID=UPI00216440E8|nr:hypothetical protein [Sphingomonas sp. SUN039]UVO54902.1 hypothetical protein M0209_12490 [Sphingomonas sp. SUN039]